MIPKDKPLHVALGVLAVFCALGALAIYGRYGLGLTLAYTSTLVGCLYEIQQWYRKDGEPDVLDAVATALPGWVAWVALEVL